MVYHPACGIVFLSLALSSSPLHIWLVYWPRLVTLVLSGADISYPNVGLDWATSPRKSVEQFLEVLAAWTVTQPSNPQCRGFALNDSLSGCVANSPSPSLPLLGNSGKYRKGGLQGSLSANGRDR